MSSSATTLTEAEIVSSLMAVVSAGAVAVAAAARLLPESRDLTSFMEIAEQTAIRFSRSASAVSPLHTATASTAARESSNLVEQIANMTAIRRVAEQAIAEATTPPTIVSAEQRRVTIKNERAVPYERPRRATTAAKRDIENLDTYIEFLDYMRNRPEHNFHHEWSFKEKVWLIILSKLFANLDINGKIRVDWKNGLRIIPLTNLKTHALIMSHWYSYRRSLKSNSWKCADRIAEKLLTENSEYFYQLKRGN